MLYSSARQMSEMNSHEILVKYSKIYRCHEGSFSPEIRENWDWDFTRTRSYCYG